MVVRVPMGEQHSSTVFDSEADRVEARAEISPRLIIIRAAVNQVEADRSW